MSLLPRHRRPLTATKAGVSRGNDLTPGAQDDGWTVQPPVTLEDGSILRLYKDAEGVRAAYQSIERARQSVFIEFYTFASDSTGQAFAHLLSQKAAEGVKVYLIYDAFGSLGSQGRMFRTMRKAGVSIGKFHPVWPWDCSFSWRPFNRDHRKLLIVDGEHVAMGGLNIGDQWAGQWVSARPDCADFWRDCSIGLSGPAARHFAQAFVQTWQYVTRGGRITRALYSHNLNFAAGPVAMLASVPTMDSPLAAFLPKLIADATRTIDLTAAYFAPSEEFLNQLCQASTRGVRVRMMLPDKTDAPIMVLAARSFYERLMDAGIHIYERRHVVLHAKTLVIDGTLSLLGSTNLDYRSIGYNCELLAGLRSTEFAQQMEKLFEHDIAHALPIRPAKWRHRPTRDRIIQWAANRSRYLL